MTMLSLLVLSVGLGFLVQGGLPAPETLPAAAVKKLRSNLIGAGPHANSRWREPAPINGDGTVTGYIEIAKGDRRKWEFDIAANQRKIDRMIPESIGGYPINYGFVPQTVSYDGDPFDVLVLGPPIEGGRTVRGVPVAVMFMEDGGVVDSKIVISPIDGNKQPLYQLTESVQQDVSSFFNRYKQEEPGASTHVPGWGSKDDGLALVRLTHAFYRECGKATDACRVSQPK